MRITNLYLLILFSVAIEPAYSDNMDVSQVDDFELAYGSSDFISIATGSMQPIEKAPAIASVITQDEIRKMGAKDIDDVLMTVPGLHISYNHLGYNPMYIIRGIYSNDNPEVLILINGSPMTNIVTGNRGYTWGGMPVEAISHIEIIRGPGSAIHGADAFSGVINIITKTADNISLNEVGTHFGSYNTKSAWFTHELQLGETTSSTLIIEGMSSDGFDGNIEQDAQSILDNLVSTNASLTPGPVNLKRESMDLRWNITSSKWKYNLGYQGRYKLGTGIGAAGALDPVGNMSSERFNTDLSYDIDSMVNHFDLNIKLSHLSIATENNFVIYPAGVKFPLSAYTFSDGMIGNPSGKESHSNIDLTGVYIGVDSHRLRVGLGYSDVSLHSITETKNFLTPAAIPSVITDVSDNPNEVYIQPRKRYSSYIYLQDEWEASADWVITAGARYDEYSDFGTTFNPRAAVVWQIDYNISAKLLYGSAFRAPSLQELYLDNNSLKKGNPDLKQEEIDTYELAINFKELDTRYGFNIFTYEAVDRISLVSNMYTNADKIKGRGAEFEFNSNITERFSLFGNASYVEVRDANSDTLVPYIPQDSLYLGFNWIPSFVTNINMNYLVNGNRLRAEGDTRAPLSRSETINLTTRYKDPDYNWETSLMIKNLLDKDRRQPVDLGSPLFVLNDLPLTGRTVFVELRYMF